MRPAAQNEDAGTLALRIPMWGYEPLSLTLILVTLPVTNPHVGL